MSHSRRFPLQLLILICLVTPNLGGAGTLEKLSFDRLSGEADVIVRGRVEEITTRKASDRRPISKIIRISVERQFKGPKVSAVTIEQSGGSEGEVTLAVPGSPEFSSGEDVILFLTRRRGGSFNIVGGKQGKFTAKTLPGNNNAVVEDFAHRTEDLNTFIDRLGKTANPPR
jgi:hypothetical protein